MSDTTVTAPPSAAIRMWGREPSALLGLVESALLVLVAFSLGVTSESAGLITALVSAVLGAWVAWATKDTLLGAATTLVKAGMALLVYYGLELTETQTVAVVALVPVVVNFWQRTQTSPVAAPVDPSPQQVVPVLPPPDVAEQLIPDSHIAVQDSDRGMPSTDHPYDGPSQDYDGYGAPISDKP